MHGRGLVCQHLARHIGNTALTQPVPTSDALYTVEHLSKLYVVLDDSARLGDIDASGANKRFNARRRTEVASNHGRPKVSLRET